MRYEDVDVDEAIDLIATLPDGSLYVAATNPARSWSERRTLAADVVDAVMWLTWALAMDHEKVTEPPKIIRPVDTLRIAAKEQRRKRAVRILRTARRKEA